MLSKEAPKLFGWQGFCVEPALPEPDIGLFEICLLFRRFDTFGNHGKLQSVSHADNVRRHDTPCRVAADRVDEGFVDLQGVKRQAFEQRQARITRPEVIDRDPIAGGACGFDRS